MSDEDIEKIIQGVVKALTPILTGKPAADDDMQYLASLPPAARKEKLKALRDAQQ